MKEFILRALEKVQNGYSLCGVVDRRVRVYPLGSDTKVISTLFELVARQAVAFYDDNAGMLLVEGYARKLVPSLKRRHIKAACRVFSEILRV